MSDLIDWRVQGIWPLQDHDRTAQLGTRSHLAAARVVRSDLDLNLPYEDLEDTRGDVLGGLMVRERDDRRGGLQGWWLTGCPVIARASPRGVRGETRQRSGEATEAWTPARNDRERDERFRDMTLGHPLFGGPLAPDEEQLYPGFWTGLVSAGSDEREQKNILHPDFLGIVAPHAAGGERHGTPVWDVSGEGDLDVLRFSRFQRLARVASMPPRAGAMPGVGGRQAGMLAWQLGVARDATDCGGLVADEVETQDPEVIGTLAAQVLSLMSARHGGPIYGGVSPDDQHLLGRSVDSEAVASAHLAKLSVFRGPRGSAWDCGLEFQEAPYEPTRPGQVWLETVLRVDRNSPHETAAGRYRGLGRWETLGAVYTIPPRRPPKPPRPPPPRPPGHPGGPGDGPPDEPGEPGGPTDDVPNPYGPIGPDDYLPGDFLPGGRFGPSSDANPYGPDPDSPVGPYEGPHGGDAGGFESPGGGTATGVRPGQGGVVQGGAAGAAAGFGLDDGDLTGAGPDIDPAEGGLGLGFRQQDSGAGPAMSASLAPIVGPSFGFRPQSHVVGSTDWRSAMGVAGALIQEYDRTAPVVAQMLGFAQQSGGGYQYGTLPGSTGLWPGGDADGGVLVVPADVDEADVVAGNRNAFFGMGPNTTFGFGVPSTDGGTLVDGWRITNRTDGDLNFLPVDSSGAPDVTQRTRFQSVVRVGPDDLSSDPTIEFGPGLGSFVADPATSTTTMSGLNLAASNGAGRTTTVSVYDASRDIIGPNTKDLVMQAGQPASGAFDTQIWGGDAAGANQDGGDVILSPGIPTGTGLRGGVLIGDVSTDRLGFFGAAVQARPAAYAQNYSTADRTLSAYTPDDESGAYTGIDNLQLGAVYATVADLNALRVAYENLRAFSEDVAQLANSMLDDCQGFGLLA